MLSLLCPVLPETHVVKRTRFPGTLGHGDVLAGPVSVARVRARKHLMPAFEIIRGITREALAGLRVEKHCLCPLC
jgi:hypothetical protein